MPKFGTLFVMIGRQAENLVCLKVAVGGGMTHRSDRSKSVHTRRVDAGASRVAVCGVVCAP